MSQQTALDLLVQHVDRPGFVRLIVASVHGALWLHTHFPEEEWTTLQSSEACFGMVCLSTLLEDARSAGLLVNAHVVVES